MTNISRKTGLFIEKSFLKFFKVFYMIEKREERDQDEAIALGSLARRPCVEF